MSVEHNAIAENDGSGSAPIHEGRALVGGLFAVFLALVAYGVLIGNVFENYQNGSNL